MCSNIGAALALNRHYVFGNGKTFSKSDSKWIEFIKRQDNIRVTARREVLKAAVAARTGCESRTRAGNWGGVFNVQVSPTHWLTMILNWGFLSIEGTWETSTCCTDLILNAKFNYWDEIVAKPSWFDDWPNTDYDKFLGDNLIAINEALHDVTHLPTLPKPFLFEVGPWSEAYIINIPFDGKGKGQNWPFTERE